MKIDALISKRFEELISLGKQLLKTKYETEGVYFTLVDRSLSQEWVVSCLSFIGRVMGKESEHYETCKELANDPSRYSNAERSLAVLKSAKAEYDNGYLFTLTESITAEVFVDFLEQADYLLSEGYYQVAAVMAGAVLEDGLRKLCVSKGVVLPDKPKLDWMNAELAKATLYNKLVQKKVTVWADIRNNAAHGKWKEFTSEDASDMVKGVRTFMAEYFGS